MIKKILQYRGNNHYFCCLCQDEEDKYFVIFARAGKINFEAKPNETIDFEFKSFTCLTQHNIVIPLTKNYYVMSVHDYNDYELINNILEVVWMEDE